ncbi:MAG: hypothetical protein V4538_14905 [Bacteroidota bacterium]
MKKYKMVLIVMFLSCAWLLVEAQTLHIEDGIYNPFKMPKRNTNIGRDTIPVILLVSDTTIPNTVGYCNGYSVRKIEYANVDVSIDPNYVLPDGGMTLMGWVPRYEERPFYTHLEYLDDKKLPLSKNIIVWQLNLK